MFEVQRRDLRSPAERCKKERFSQPSGRMFKGKIVYVQRAERCLESSGNTCKAQQKDIELPSGRRFTAERCFKVQRKDVSGPTGRCFKRTGETCLNFSEKLFRLHRKGVKRPAERC